jgi:hypothetical protein
MPTGLAVPVGVGQDGGARLADGDGNDAKIILLALGSDDNENAFQQNIGLGEGMVFDIADPTSRSRITRRLVEIFRRFEAQQRYILRTNTIQWTQDSNNQTTYLSFLYVQVESDQEKEFRQQFSRPDSSGAT